MLISEDMQNKFQNNLDKLPPFNKFIWDYRIEILSGFLMLVGIVLSFFYRQIGGAFVGLGFGMCFFVEIHAFFLSLRNYYAKIGIFKTLMLLGAVVYFLITIPAFIIAVVLGYAIVYLINTLLKKPE